MQNFNTSVDGVGRLSVLQNTLGETSSDVTFGKRITNSETNNLKNDFFNDYHQRICFV